MVATVLTACGIETITPNTTVAVKIASLQQYLPLAVLKLTFCCHKESLQAHVATVLTACGIETEHGDTIRASIATGLQQYLPLAVLKHI